MTQKYALLPIVLVLLVSQSLQANQPVPCQISVTGGQTSICQGQPLVLIGQTALEADEVSRQLWETNGKLLSDNGNNFTRLDTSTPGSYVVTYKVWDATGNENSCTVKIEVAGPPEFEIVENFGFFQRILFKKPMPRLRILSEESHTFQWFLNGNEISGASEAVYKPSAAGKYSVKVTSQQGCSAFSKDIIVD
ncbi:MAG: DUF5011 domain-containing protein [Bacteroidales bacterium]|nr:DUF5011 domain-containing protein [Bacteroidales bacterium]